MNFVSQPIISYSICRIDGRSFSEYLLAMSRSNLVNIHLVLSFFFLPFLLLMPTTGALYLLGEKGSVKKEAAFSVANFSPKKKKDESFWREQFEKNGIDFEFEYIKDKGDKIIFRPAHRDHFEAKLLGDSAEVYHLKPNLLKKLIELHLGHGPTLFKRLETAFGIALILLTISGLWLGLSVEKYRRTVLTALGAGCTALLIALFF